MTGGQLWIDRIEYTPEWEDSGLRIHRAGDTQD